MNSWKTTVAGVAAVLGAVALALKALADGDYATFVGSLSGIAAGVGLLFARDNDKSREDVGTK